MLNFEQHKDVKIITERGEQFGDNLMLAPTFPEEFVDIQAHYPIVFHKEDDRFTAFALFGLEKNENLFLVDDKWDCTYIPHSVQCRPFMIGFQQFEQNGVTETREMIHLDTESPRINRERGELLFNEDGSTTEYLNRINAILGLIHTRYQEVESFIATLTEYDLLEPFSAEITLNNGSEYRLAGFYTINETALESLSGEVLEQLNKKKYLKPIYMAIASISKINALVQRRNEKLA